MALTKEEERELAELNGLASLTTPRLSQQEEAELAQLENEIGGQPSEKPGLLSRIGRGILDVAAESNIPAKEEWANPNVSPFLKPLTVPAAYLAGGARGLATLGVKGVDLLTGGAASEVASDIGRLIPSMPEDEKFKKEHPNVEALNRMGRNVFDAASLALPNLAGPGKLLVNPKMLPGEIGSMVKGGIRGLTETTPFLNKTRASIAARDAANLPAMKAGIPLSAAEQLAPVWREATGFTGALEGTLEKTAFGSGPAADFRAKQLEAVQNKLISTGEDIGPEVGTAVEGGQKIQGALKRGLESERVSTGKPYEELGKIIGDQALDSKKIQNDLADHLASKDVMGDFFEADGKGNVVQSKVFNEPSYGSKLSPDAQGLVMKFYKDVPNVSDYEGLRRFRTQFRGKSTIFEEKGKLLPEDKVALQNVDKILTQGMEDHIFKTMGKPGVDDFRAANKAYEAYLEVKNNTKISSAVKEKNVQNIFTALVNNRSLNEIETMKVLMEPSEFQVVQRTLYDKILTDVQESIGPKGTKTTPAVAVERSVNKIGKDVLNSVFTPEQISSLGDAMAAIDRTGSASRAWSNASGTARSTENLGLLLKPSWAQTATSLAMSPISKAVYSEMGRKAIPAASNAIDLTGAYLKDMRRAASIPGAADVTGQSLENEARKRRAIQMMGQR